MSKAPYFSLLLTFLLLACNTPQEVIQGKNPAVDDFQSLTELFRNPTADYSTVPFWVWNDKVTEEKITTQLAEFKSQGINSVMIHCRPGLITEYLSDEWFALNQFALSEAMRMDMKLWLYDENCFPSGYAGGHVQREMPESYQEGTGLRLYKKETLSKKDSIAYLVLRKTDDSFEEITDRMGELVGQRGDYYLYEKTHAPVKERMGGLPYPDLLVPGVTEKFIEITMPGYERTMGDEFGKNIRGIFTDEPHIQPPVRGDIRWTPSLFEDFEKRWGYRLEPQLPAIHEEVGDFKKVRHDYYQLLIELFVERWSKPWHAYTEANQLNWTGHYWEHGWPNPRHAGDNMILYAYHQVPGIDMLFNDIEARPDQFGNIFAGRELLSVANQFGRRRTLSETYGASGWDLDFASMKRLGDWEYAAGVNLMNQHLAYMTTKGARKRDFPQSISWHASWWPHYHRLAEHYARLSVAMSSGKNINDILLIEPTTTTWMYFTPEQDKDFRGASGITKSYGEDFKDFVGLLESLKIEYDLGSEMVIREFGNTENGQFVIEQRAYEQVILGPHVENLNRETFELLSQFTAEGGMVYYYGELPSRINGLASEEAKKLAASQAENWIKIGDDTEQLMALFGNTAFKLEEASHPDKLFHQRRQLEDGELVFWTNFDPENISTFTFSIEGASLSWLDTFSGEVYSLPAEKTDGQLRCRLRLHPGESKLLYVHHEEVNLPAVPGSSKEMSIVESSAAEIERMSDNLLILDYCDVQAQSESAKGINYLHATDSIFKWHGFPKADIDHNPWNFTIQYKTELLDMNDDFGPESGFTATFPFEIAESYELKPLRFGIEYGHLYEVKLNGKSLNLNPELSYFDHSVDVYQAESSLLRYGQNLLTLSLSPMHIHAELERVFVLGDFHLKATEQGFIIDVPKPMTTGNWVVQGMPFYPEAVSYRKRFSLMDEPQQVTIRLGAWQGAVASVQVNGEDAGIIGWPPYQLDISEYAKPGENQLAVEVYATPRNQLGPHYYDPPKGIATPWSWNRAPAQQPPGDDYSLVPYGLMEDFEILAE